MTADNNKGISQIDYNHLNLPEKVDFGGGNYIEYLYDAAGIKLQQKVFESSLLTKTTDYVGGIIYENDTLQFIQHAEGRVVYDPTDDSYDYQYHMKDHLGNVRLTFSETLHDNIPEPIRIPRDAEALYLLQQIRDEAHRFAITYHRQLRSKSMVDSVLDEVPGIGAKRKRDLLRRFGSLKKIREAAADDLAGVVPRNVADDLYAALHS